MWLFTVHTCASATPDSTTPNDTPSVDTHPLSNECGLYLSSPCDTYSTSIHLCPIILVHIGSMMNNTAVLFVQVRSKLEEGRYEGAEDVARDVRLIWSNCILYNSPGSEFGQLAAGLAKKFEERYSKIKVTHKTMVWWDVTRNGATSSSCAPLAGFRSKRWVARSVPIFIPVRTRGFRRAVRSSPTKLRAHLC